MIKFSVTDLISYSECRRKWYLEKNWSLSKPPPQFWFGSTIHAGLEELYRTLDYDKARLALDNYIRTSLITLEENTGALWETVRQEFDDLADLARKVFENYLLYSESHPLGGEVRAVELPIKIPLFEDWRYGKVILSGRIDLVLETDDGLWIVDHKTSSSSMNFSGLDMDEQLTAYAFMAQWALKRTPYAVMYNVLIKDAPQPPRVLKDGSLSKDISQKTTYEWYLQELQARGEDPADYQTVLFALQTVGWGKFFQRESGTRNTEELSRYHQRAIRKTKDLIGILTDPDKNAYPNPSTYRCGYCPFVSVCKSIEDGGDGQAILEAHFQSLSSSPQEKTIPYKKIS